MICKIFNDTVDIVDVSSYQDERIITQADLNGNKREVDYFKMLYHNSSRRNVGNHEKAKARWPVSVCEFKRGIF
jgi:hypothetical protein